MIRIEFGSIKKIKVDYEFTLIMIRIEFLSYVQ